MEQTKVICKWVTISAAESHRQNNINMWINEGEIISISDDLLANLGVDDYIHQLHKYNIMTVDSGIL